MTDKESQGSLFEQSAPEPPEVPGRLVSRVDVSPEGVVDVVRVEVLGEHAGNLVVGFGNGRRIARLLKGAGDEPTSEPTSAEISQWITRAECWLDVDTIDTDPPGEVGRIILRLIDALVQVRSERAESIIDQGAHDVPWLVKDFHALYRAAEAALPANGKKPPPNAVEWCRMQLDRLRPAMVSCESVRIGVASEIARTAAAENEHWARIEARLEADNVERAKRGVLNARRAGEGD